METAERTRTGISSLKVRFNRVFGYYIEISKANLHLEPIPTTSAKQTIRRRRTLQHAALRDYEAKISRGRTHPGARAGVSSTRSAAASPRAAGFKRVPGRWPPWTRWRAWPKPRCFGTLHQATRTTDGDELVGPTSGNPWSNPSVGRVRP